MSTAPQHESIMTDDGEVRILNLMPSPPESIRRYSALPPLEIPTDQIKDFDAWPSQVQIKDQDGAGACNGHATATAVEFTRAMTGLDYQALSAWWVYGNLVHGWDRGSNISDALTLIQQSGVAPETDVKYKDFSGKYSDQAKSDALLNRVEIGSALTTWGEILTAVALRKGVNLSVRATNSWSGRLDANGCPPVGVGPGNHAVMVGGGIKTLPTGKKAVRMANSWGTSWGLNGFCWLTEDHFMRGTWREAIVINGVVAASGVPGVA